MTVIRYFDILALGTISEFENLDDYMTVIRYIFGHFRSRIKTLSI